MWQTILLLKSGSVNPLFTVNVTTSTFPSTSSEPAEVAISNLTITSQSSADAPGQGVAHGIMLINNASHYHATRVYLQDILLGGVPGDGLHCGGTQGGGTGGFDGWVEAHGVIAQYSGGLEFYNNSCTDTRWFGGEIAGAGGTNDGLLISGGGSFIFDGTNFYANGGNDIEIYQSDKNVFANCTIDETGRSNMLVQLSSGQRLDVIGSQIRWASSATASTYSDLTISAGNAGNIYLTADRFGTLASSPSPNKPLNNINFVSGNTGKVFASNVSYDLGDVLTAGVTNAPGSVISTGGAEGTWAPALAGTTTPGTPVYSVTPVGSWSRNGAEVTVHFLFQTSSLGGATGLMKINGLPFTSSATSNDFGSCVLNQISGWTAATNYTVLTPFVNVNSQSILLYENGSGQPPAATPNTELAASTKLAGSCVYHTD